MRLQRAEQRWVLWGREASVGKDAAEQRLGSFDAVVLCDALTARKGQCAGTTTSHDVPAKHRQHAGMSLALHWSSVVYAPGLVSIPVVQGMSQCTLTLLDH